MLDAVLKGALIFFAMIGMMEFVYILYSVFTVRILKSDFWIVVRPHENESIEAVIRSLKSCVDESLAKQTQASVVIVSEDESCDALCESCRAFAQVQRCTEKEIMQIVKAKKE